MWSPAEDSQRTTAWLQAADQRLYRRRAAMPGIKPNLRRRRGRIAVLTDSACGLPCDPQTGELALGPLGAGVFSVPIPVMIGDQMYPEAGPELAAELPVALAAGTRVQTSRPSPGRLLQAYRQLQQQGYAGVVSAHLSSKLSGTVESARLAAAQVDLPVTVVDSEQAGLGLGQAVLEAAITARLAGSMQQVADALKNQAAASSSFFAVPSLEQLRRGGRLSPVAGLIGSLLNVKPVLTLKDGEISLLERTRSFPRAVERLVGAAQNVAEQGHSGQEGMPGQHPSGPTGVRYAVHCFGDRSTAEQVAERLDEASAEPVPIVDLPAGLAAHLGLGAVAVVATTTLPGT